MPKELRNCQPNGIYRDYCGCVLKLVELVPTFKLRSGVVVDGIAVVKLISRCSKATIPSNRSCTNKRFPLRRRLKWNWSYDGVEPLTMQNALDRLES